MTLPPALAIALAQIGVIAPKPPPRPDLPAPWTPKRPGEDPPF